MGISSRKGNRARRRIGWKLRSLHALWSAFFLLLAFHHDGGTQATAQIVGQFVKLGVAVDFDGLLGRVADHVAVVAPGKMVLQFDLGRVVEDTVQIVGQLVQKFSAFHWLPSPLAMSPFLPLPLSRR